MSRLPSPTDLAKHPITTLLGGLAVAVSIASFIGRDVGPLVMDVRAFRGEPWRAFTSVLPHVNPLHLAFNVAWLWVFGAAIEERLGALRFLGVVLLLAGGPILAEYALYGAGVGLSGVVYGLFALVWILGRRDAHLRTIADAKTTQMFVGWFFFCIATTALGVLPVANVAHGVGALLGALLGLALLATGLGRALAALAIPALLGVSLAGATVLRPRVNLAKDRGNDSAYLAYVALEAGRNDEAVAFYREALRVNPALGDGWYNLGITYERLGRSEEAQEAFQRALDLDPTSDQRRRALAGVPWRLAEHAEKEGRNDEAAALYQRSIALYDRDPGPWTNLGRVHMARADHAAAMVAFQRVLELEPGNTTVRRALADTKVFLAYRAGQEGDDAASAKLYEEALALGSDRPELLRNLAIAYDKLGRKADSAATWARLEQR